MKSLVGTIFAAGMVAASGVVHGWFTNRWGDPPQFEIASAQLAAVPTQFGPWKARPTPQVPPTVLNILECKGHHYQIYENEQTGELVNVAVFLGPPGPISVHTPEVCYPSQNFQVVERGSGLRLGAAEGEEPDQMWRLTFRSNDLNAQTLRVFYGWSDGGPWQADDNPRVSHAGDSHLYKLQLAASVPPDQEQNDLAERFLNDFLPVLDAQLVKH